MFFGSLSNARSKKSAHVLLGEGSGKISCWEKGNFMGHVLAEKKVTLWWLMNSNMVKPEQFDHLHLVYHSKIPLRASILKNICKRLLLEVFYTKAVLKNNIHKTKVGRDKSSVKKSINMLTSCGSFLHENTCAGISF